MAECYKVIYQEVLAMSSRSQEFSISLFSNFIDPVTKMGVKYSAVFEKLLSTLDSQLNEITVVRNSLRENRELYYQMASNCEKAQNNLNSYFADLEAGRLSKPEFERESRKVGELKKYAEESREGYVAAMEKSNLQWHQLFSNFPQFLKTLSSTENERRAVTVSVSKVLCKLLDQKFLYSGKSRKKIQDDLNEAMNEAMMAPPTNLHMRIEALSGVSLGLNQEEFPKHNFMSYESFKIERMHALKKDGFIVVEDDSELNSKEQKKLVNISDDLFQNIDKPLRLTPKPSEQDLEGLFIKEQAALEFLLRGQQHLASHTFQCQFAPDKFDLLKSILKILVTS